MAFAQNFSQRRIPFENAESTAIWNAAESDSLFIPTFAADHRGPYLPASALKGALRSGLVFSRWSAGTLDRIAAALEGDRVARRVAEPAENAAGASQVRVIAAADSQPVPVSSFKVYLTRVASLDTRQGAGTPQLVWKVAGRGSVQPQRVADATPLFAEMAVPGTAFEGTWQERTFLEDPELTRALGWRSAPDPKVIVEASNQYAAAQIESHAKYAEVTGLKGLTQTVQRLKSELESAQADPLSCLLCLGWGGGFVSKAAFLDTDLESYRKILRAVPSFGRSIREGVPFPKTRRVIFMGGQPSSLPGWVKLQFEK